MKGVYNFDESFSFENGSEYIETQLEYRSHIQVDHSKLKEESDDLLVRRREETTKY
jgi:hypothetical protein